MQVKKVKPHVLLGLSGVGGVFSQEVDTFSIAFGYILRLPYHLK